MAFAGGDDAVHAVVYIPGRAAVNRHAAPCRLDILRYAPRPSPVDRVVAQIDDRLPQRPAEQRQNGGIVELQVARRRHRGRGVARGLPDSGLLLDLFPPRGEQPTPATPRPALPAQPVPPPPSGGPTKPR